MGGGHNQGLDPRVGKGIPGVYSEGAQFVLLDYSSFPMHAHPPLLPPSTLIRGFRHDGVIYKDITLLDDAGADMCLRHGMDVWIVNTYLLIGELASIKYLGKQMAFKPVKFRGFGPSSISGTSQNNQS